MLKRKFTVLVLILMLIFMACAPAHAYLIAKPWPYSGSGYLYVYYTWGSSMPFSSEWKNHFSQSATDWTVTPTQVIYSYSGSAANKLGIVGIVNGSFGYTWITPTADGRYISSFSAAANTATTGGFSSNAKRSVTGHELGHGLGLNDFNLSPALMDQGRNRDTIYIPQVDDVNGINAMY